MTSHSFNDPSLQGLEAALASHVPRLSAAEQQQLFYRCAFAAGRQAGNRPLWRWRAAAGALAMVAACLAVPLATRDAALPAMPQHAPVAAAPHAPSDAGAASPTAPAAALPAVAAVPASPKPLQIDAWQVARSPSEALEAELAEFRRTAPHLRSLAAGTFIRSQLDE